MEPTLQVDGLLGRSVARVEGTPEVLIPASAQRQSLRWTGVPFIGVYTPTLRIESASGTRTIDLPRVWVLPPWPYILAVGVALLVLLIGVIRHRRRTGWRAYLDDDDPETWELHPDE
jgi:hypothetical protein